MVEGKVHVEKDRVYRYSKQRRVFMEWSLLRNGLNDSQYYHRIQVILCFITDSYNRGRKIHLTIPLLFHG